METCDGIYGSGWRRVERVDRCVACGEEIRTWVWLTSKTFAPDGCVVCWACVTKARL
jgi:hypothetical protein